MTITETKKKMYVELPIRVKTYDIDFMNVASNTVYVKWFEDLRMAVLDKYFPLKDMLKDNKSPIIAETLVKYKRPITLDNKLLGKAWMTELGKSKWVMDLEIWDGETLHCEGRQTGYYFDLATNKPTRFPDKLIEFYNGL